MEPFFLPGEDEVTQAQAEQAKVSQDGTRGEFLNGTQVGRGFKLDANLW